MIRANMISEFAVRFDGEKWRVVEPIARNIGGGYASVMSWGASTQENMDKLEVLLGDKE